MGPFLVTLLASSLGLGQHEEHLSLLGRAELDCPVCAQRFTTVVVAQSNTRGGVDRDLFARAVGPQPVFFRISTCPKCGYSGYPRDFASSVSLPPDVREKILREPALALPEEFTPESDPRELGAPERYALAIQCYTWLQRSDEALAWLHLRASWVQRDLGSMLPPDERIVRVMDYIERYRPAMEAGGNQMEVEMQLVTRVAEAIALGEFNRYQRPYVELVLAMLWRRHGENHLAEPTLKKLQTSDRFTEEVREAIATMLSTMRKEREAQAEAARYFEKALLADQIREENRATATYLLGELHRRLGQDHLARRWFTRALQQPSTDEETWRAWAKAFLDRQSLP